MQSVRDRAHASFLLFAHQVLLLRVLIFCQSCLDVTTNSKVERLEVFGRQTPDTGVSRGNWFSAYI